MREIALCSRFRRDRDRSTACDEPRRPARHGDVAARTSGPISPCFRLPRSLRLFAFLRRTSAGANRMSWSAHPESPCTVVRRSRLLVRELCGGRHVNTARFPLSNDGTCSPFVAAGYRRPHSVTEREMEFSSHLSPSETDVSSAGQVSRRKRNRMATEIGPRRGSRFAPLLERMARTRPYLKEYKAPAVTGVL